MKAMQAIQQKLQTSGSLMSAEARGQLEREIERQQNEGERYEQDAQAELNEMQQQLQQAEYNRKLFPVLEQLAKEMGLSMLFSAADSGLIWARTRASISRRSGQADGCRADAAEACTAAHCQAGCAPRCRPRRKPDHASPESRESRRSWTARNPGRRDGLQADARAAAGTGLPPPCASSCPGVLDGSRWDALGAAPSLRDAQSSPRS